MSVEKVREYLRQFGYQDKILEFDKSSATVELAAIAVGVDKARIAKTLSFHGREGGCILIVVAGDAKIDNPRFKHTFGMKARMLSADEALSFTGHAVGGVCPFALPQDVKVYADRSLGRFKTVFPACGSSNSAIELSPDELFRISGAVEWVDVCKDWQPEDERQ